MLQAANSLQLCRFIQADLDTFRPKLSTTPSFSTPEALSSSFDYAAPTTDPNFPKSLYLIQPLFEAYELNPVALTAQASVPIPEGLDLDLWITEPPREVVPEGQGEQTVKKGKKGKGKDGSGNRVKSGKKRQKAVEMTENGDVLIPAEAETPEEAAERAKVNHHSSHFSTPKPH